MLLAQTPVNLQLTSFNMDASMPDAELDLSDGAYQWVAVNKDKLEALVQSGEKVWSLTEWEVFQDWAYNESNKLTEARQRYQTAERELEPLRQRYQTAERELETLRRERRQMSATIDRLEPTIDRLTAQSRGGQLSSHPQNYRTGINALTRLVLRVTRADERRVQPATDETHLMDHIDQLVDRMIVNEEQRRMAEDQQTGNCDWDPATSLLANEAMHNALYFR